jgi:hypothetical protein
LSPPGAAPTPAPPDPTLLRDAVRAQTGQLCERIRCGDADDPPMRDAVLGHVRAEVRRKLLVTNPAWLGEGAGAKSTDRT